MHINLECSCEGRLVAHCTLRLLNPECHLASDWSAEPLHLQSSRAVLLLHNDSVSVASSSSSQAPQQCGVSGLLSAPTLAYCFPLLRAVVTLCKNSEQNESLLVTCLDILSTHAAKLRSDDPSYEVFIYAAYTQFIPATYFYLFFSFSQHNWFYSKSLRH